MSDFAKATGSAAALDDEPGEAFCETDVGSDQLHPRSAEVLLHERHAVDDALRRGLHAFELDAQAGGTGVTPMPALVIAVTSLARRVDWRSCRHTSRGRA